MAENSYDGMTLAEKVLHQIRVSDTVLQKAASTEKEQQEKTAAITALIPSVVESLVQNERILPNQQEKLAEVLKDPVQTLDLLIKVAAHRTVDEVATLGHGVGEKTASANSHTPARSLSDPFVGGRTTTVKQSSVNLFRGLGLTQPTEG